MSVIASCLRIGSIGAVVRWSDTVAVWSSKDSWSLMLSWQLKQKWKNKKTSSIFYDACCEPLSFCSRQNQTGTWNTTAERTKKYTLRHALTEKDEAVLSWQWGSAERIWSEGECRFIIQLNANKLQRKENWLFSMFVRDEMTGFPSSSSRLTTI